jgi:hypothetical protein
VLFWTLENLEQEVSISDAKSRQVANLIKAGKVNLFVQISKNLPPNQRTIVKNNKKHSIKEGFKYLIKTVLSSSSQVRVRSGNRIRAFFTCCIAQVNGIFVATCLARAPDEAVSADTFFVNQVVDHCVHPIPAKLLSSLA